MNFWQTVTIRRFRLFHRFFFSMKSKIITMWGGEYWKINDRMNGSLLEKNSKGNEKNYCVLFIGNTRRYIINWLNIFYLIVNLIDLELPFLTKKIITCLNILFILLSDFYGFFDWMIVYIVVYFMRRNKGNNIT